jgi:metallo-beta-lactamase superfamily protein
VSEPKAVADRVEEVLPGLWRWSIHDERIDFLGAAYAVAGDEGTVLIDPEPIVPDALAQLGTVQAIVLSAGSHQRSAWRLRRELGVPLWAPELVREVEEEPDVRYGDGDTVPGALRAVFTPGAGTTQHTLLRAGDPALVFISDLLLQTGDGTLELVPDRYLHDPDEARRSIRTVLELPFDVACFTHGGVVQDDPKGAIAAALER